MDYKTVNPSLNVSVFPTTPSSLFWSGSDHAGYPYNAWNVDFSYGVASNDPKVHTFHARLVRGGQSLGSFPLAVTPAGSGSGSITSLPAGIDCGTGCNDYFRSGSTVTLTATPAAGSSFTDWSGACANTANTCTVTLTAATSVTATFAARPVPPQLGSIPGQTGLVGTPFSLVLSSFVTPTNSDPLTSWAIGTGTLPPGLNLGNGVISGTPTAAGSYTVSVTASDIDGASNAVPIVFTISPAPVSRYIDNNDGTVTDPSTGLTWMRCSVGQTWTGSTCTGDASTHTWDQANVLVPGSFAGRNDWRLPNIRELKSIVELSRADPAIDVAAFPGTPASTFWSDSAMAAYSVNAWLVQFYYGTASFNLKNSSHHVRLVHGGRSSGSLLNVARPTSDYTVHDDGTVTHQPTGLMWQRCSVGQSFSVDTCNGAASTQDWAAAASLTNDIGGHTDWRLPTERELLTLVDYTIFNPSLNQSIFPTTPASLFWSASAVAGYPEYAWGVYFGDGYTGNDGDKLGTFHARLVRGGQSLGSFPLTVTPAGSGSGSITSLPAGIDCGTGCSDYFRSGSTVTLTATPAAGSSFAGWTSACSGTGNCSVTMSIARSVGASFTSISTTQVSLGSLAHTYDGTAKSASCSSTPAGLTTNISYSDSGSGTGRINAGSYDVSCIITQSGDSGSASGTLIIAKASQNIAFPAISAKTLGALAFNVSASADSGLTVGIGSQTSSVCTVSGSTVTLLTAGICTLRANQAGNGNYEPATAEHSFAVQAVTSGITRTVEVIAGWNLLGNGFRPHLTWRPPLATPTGFSASGNGSQQPAAGPSTPRRWQTEARPMPPPTAMRCCSQSTAATASGSGPASPSASPCPKVMGSARFNSSKGSCHRSVCLKAGA